MQQAIAATAIQHDVARTNAKRKNPVIKTEARMPVPNTLETGVENSSDYPTNKRLYVTAR